VARGWGKDCRGKIVENLVLLTLEQRDPVAPDSWDRKIVPSLLRTVFRTLLTIMEPHSILLPAPSVRRHYPPCYRLVQPYCLAGVHVVPEHRIAILIH
jgi:hypothetical protein